MQVYTERQLLSIPQLNAMSRDQLFAMQVVAKVLPFRVNNHVLEALIDWSNIPKDPIFQLTFPQEAMLRGEHFQQVANLLSKSEQSLALQSTVSAIRATLNPHPADQLTLNIPKIDDQLLVGLQHKYRETVLFFPHHGQTCHSYCSFCFRWPQFTGDKSTFFASKHARSLFDYLELHSEVSDLVLTGGDPCVMKTSKLSEILLPLLHSKYEHVQNIRIGTKALTYWPYRFTTDDDAGELLQLIETLVKGGKHVAIMAHLNHWREIDNSVAELAINNLRNAGAVIRSQGPVLAHVNDSADVWMKMWKQQIKLGIIPYYLFVARDTGAKQYFEVPLIDTYYIFRDAYRQVSGLAKTVRGPSMSVSPGKIEIQGTVDLNNESAFALRFIQARNPAWVQQTFFAKFDAKATWFDQLKPLVGDRFFFEE